MELRQYQKEQLASLLRYKGIVRGLESPTGSGKSVVLWEYIKQCFDDYDTIVYTTGFNDLIFQFYDIVCNECYELDMNIEPQVLMGRNHLILNNDNSIEYSIDKQNLCNGKRSECHKCNECKLDIIDKFMARKKKFIITNHSYYLIYKDKLNADLLIIDECHTMPSFWNSYLKKSLSNNYYEAYKHYCNNVHTVLSSTFKSCMDKPIDDRLLKQVAKEIYQYSKMKLDDYKQFERNFLDVFRTYKAGMLIDDGDCLSTYIYEDRVDYGKKSKSMDVILTSATIDQYSLQMLNCRRDQIYRQKMPNDRYKNSNYISVAYDYREKFEDIWNNYLKKLKKGLILCTTLENVRWTKELLYKYHINVYSSIKEFKSAKNGILVGSKKYFQGIDVPNLDYVVLDKLPFEIWDKNYQGYSHYIKVTTKKDSWNNLSLPMMQNSLLQAFGRLWRKNNIDKGDYDNGTIVLFDERLSKHFRSVDDFIIKEKSGINYVKIEPKNKED